VIPAPDLRMHERDDDTQEPQHGERLMGSRYVPAITLAGDSYSEVEFTVKVTRAIPLGQDFEFRLVESGRAILGATTAQARSSWVPKFSLSPGQRNGIDVGPPVDAKPAAVSEMDFPLVTPAFAGAWPETNGTPVYRLAVAVPTTPGTEAPLYALGPSPHAPDVSLVSDTCAICHRSHVAQGPTLLTSGTPQSTLCFTCHDGTGSTLNTKSQFDTAPANDPATRSYYRHDATVATTHTLAQDNEFGGVSNRHSECGDCHNPHNATDGNATQTTAGWTVAGSQAAISGVSVANGAAGTAPTYAFLDGSVGFKPTLEYQICLKCHSGFTTLPSNATPVIQPPSRMTLDKGIELNPGLATDTASYHPVEAAGKNQTDAMAGSLSGTSPYKQWDFTRASTVRCVNCHGDPQKFVPQPDPPVGPLGPPAGSDLAPHTSQYRGILIQNYRDRVLKGPTEDYDAADFALCFVCHAERPFRTSISAQTAFGDHDLHMSSNAEEGPGGTDIDTAGQGGGNAICAECHFRIHGTALAYNEGDRSNPRLVNFSPNVEPFKGVLRFTKTATGGTCTLVCHGAEHDAEDY